MGGPGPSDGQWQPPTVLDIQWCPAPPPGVWPRLPGPLRLLRGCAGQGATWSGFLVRRARPIGTSEGAGAWNVAGGNGPHCLVTRVCKRQTLSECGSALPPPGWGWISLLPVSLQGSRKEKTTATSLKCYQDITSFSLQSPVRLVPFSPLFYEKDNLSSARLSDLPKDTHLESSRART